MKSKDDGRWGVFYPSDIERANTGKNGFIKYGKIADSILIYFKKPDDVTMTDLIKKPRLLLDLILKGFPITRNVGGENIRITSMGDPAEEYIFIDSYGRRWLVRTWLLEYSDQKLVLFCLPVPGGFDIIMKLGQTGLVNNGFIPDMKKLVDFIYISYYGILNDWKEFLSLKDILPSLFSKIKISFDYNKRFDFESDRLQFSVTPEVMDIKEESDFIIYTAYFKEDGKVVWDVGSVGFGEDKNSNTYFSINRTTYPSQELREMNDSYQKNWDDMVKERYPYNKTAVFKDGNTVIRSVHHQDDCSPSKCQVIYTILYQRDGNISDKDMNKILKKIDKNVKVKEVKALSLSIKP